MKKKNLLPILAIFFTVLLLLSISKGASERLRSTAATVTSPIWSFFTQMKSMISNPNSQEEKSSHAELLQLTLENQRLKQNLETAYQFIYESLSLSKNQQVLSNALTVSPQLNYIKSLQQYHLTSVPAEVIYRSPTTWNCSLWINKGHRVNRELGHEIIAKNSPVVVGNALIGLIDYVGEGQSRVRLITDSALTIAVRAARGYPQKLRAAENIHFLINFVLGSEIDGITQKQKKQIAQQLKTIQKLFLKPQETLLLAKGELHGSSPPLWRSRGQFLIGIGFNYDFADDEGPARNLRSGIPFRTNDHSDSVQLLKEKDLLITTGMDGVFPAGLEVAEVVKIDELEEGDYTYKLLAKPIADNLDELSLLFVMPPLGYDPR